MGYPPWVLTMRMTLRFACIIMLFSTSLLLAQNKNADLDKLQGQWEEISRVLNGESKEVKKTIVKLKGNDYETLSEGKIVESGIIIFDASTKPKSYTVTIIHETGTKVLVYSGIYELTKDTLKMCVNTNEGQDAPKKFESKADSGHQLVVWKRLPAPPKTENKK